MAGSTFGTLFKITTWGESHGAGVGVVVDGCPAGLSLCEDDIQKFLNRRKPGQSRYTTPRKEDDAVEILSGVFEGRTTGTPISMLVRNQNQRSKDYSEIASYYRPGHADYTFDMKYGFRDYRGGGRSSGRADLTFDLKYGFRDYRGGGRSSGRETIGRVAAGAIAARILDQLGIHILTYTRSIGDITADPSRFDRSVIMENPFYMPDADAAEKAGIFLEECMKNEDSSGGSIECVIQNMPAGIGEPVFEKLSANLGKAILSIGAVKAFEIGDGTAVAHALGHTNNDQYTRDPDGKIIKLTNHSGGILGGISDGSDILLRASIKPTPSISREQSTVTKDGGSRQISVKGRHDPVIVPRAVVVVESMAAITLVDMLMCSITSNMADLDRFFRR